MYSDVPLLSKHFWVDIEKIFLIEKFKAKMIIVGGSIVQFSNAKVYHFDECFEVDAHINALNRLKEVKT